MIAETATTQTITYRHIEDDIVEILFFDNQVIMPENVMDNYETLDYFTDFKPHKRLIISGHFTEITHAARNTLLRENKKREGVIIAEAIVIHSVAQKIFSYLYYKLNDGNHPIHIFDSLSEAMEWLRSQ